MKRFITALTLMLLTCSVLLLGGCGFFEEEAGILISSVDVEENEEDGSTKITINFTDEYIPKKEFIIPKGEEGERGVGIDYIEVKDRQVGDTFTTLVIHFDDEGKTATEVVLNDGRSITDIETVPAAEDGAEGYNLKFSFSDDTPALEVPFPKLVEIQDIQATPEVDEDGNETGDTIIDIIWGTGDSATDKNTQFEIEKGERGNGIENIEIDGTQVDDTTGTEYYVLNVTFTDKTSGPNGDGIQQVYLPKPANPNEWFTGEVAPSAPRNGDFWFNETDKTIYLYKANDWDPVISFNKLVPTYHTVSFYKNDGTPEGEIEPNDVLIVPGNCFASAGKSVPIPERAGYTFVGWYTVSEDINEAVHQKFTDLVYVNSDLKLYAIWQAE